MPASRVDVEATIRRNAAYFMALGEFYHAYTSLEHHLTCCVRNAVTGHTAAGSKEFRLTVAVLGGLRMAPAKDTIKRILRVIRADKEVRRFFDDVFSQLGEIQWLRDRLAHHITYCVTTSEPHRWHNEDYAAAREMEKIEGIEFDLATIQNATRDLEAIKFGTDGVITPLLRGDPITALQAPAWHYKPSQLSRSRPNVGGNRIPLTHPPQSSAE